MATNDDICSTCFAKVPAKGGLSPVEVCDCGSCRCDGCIQEHIMSARSASVGCGTSLTACGDAPFCRKRLSDIYFRRTDAPCAS